MTTLSSQGTLLTEILSNLNKFYKPLIGLVLIYLLIRKINMDKETRGRQIFMPLVAVLYSVAAIIGGMIFLEKINWEQIWNIFSKVANSWLASKGLKSIIHNYVGGELVYLNMVLMFLFIPFKSIAKGIMNKYMSKQINMEIYAADYYEYSIAHANWFLRNKWRGFQRLINVLAKVSVVLSAAGLCFCWVYEIKKGILFEIFPFVIIIIADEIASALDGYTKDEYENIISGDNTMLAGRIGNYQKLLDVYEHLFGNALINSYRGTEYTPKEGPSNYLEELSASESPVDKLAAHYFEQQKTEGVMLDVDYMHGTVQLLHRESVIFANPFYRDMSKYILLPLVDSLIRGYNCLFLVGEKDIADDTKAWINEMLEDYARVSGIWRVEKLSKNKPDCDVGIMDFPSLYDVKIQEANSEFFQNVAICVLVETSNMIPTAQIGLSIVVKELNKQKIAPIYCIIDRTSDGLVDTFSHVLMTNITKVIAPPIPRCIYTSAVWDADEDYQRQKWFKKQTRFLGNAVELGAAALKNQIPHVTWYGGRKAPVRDVEWIAGQYYTQIAEYAHMVKQQTSLNQRFSFYPNFWEAKTEDEQFLIVEDQYCNMFETLRMFLSRGEQQSFVNVISDSYLLRDYMQYNKQVFLSDPKAIPSILPDYARTERNITLQLILRMAIEPIPEHEIAAELLLVDRNIDSVSRELLKLIRKYTLVPEEDVVTIENRVVDPDSPTSDMEQYYYIRPGVFEKFFKNTLKNAYYVTETEKFETEYVDAKMYGLLTQCLLPGQFITVEGKYYQAEKINPEYGVLLRRASDRYDHRTSYRQIRRYVFEPDSEKYITVSNRKIMDIEIAMERRNFRVVTEGYLDMRAYHDLRSARVVDYTTDSVYEKLSMKDVDFENDVSRHPMERAYHNKNMLRIYLPDTDINMRRTLAMLLQELFKTIYPDNWMYLAVLTEKPEDYDGMLKYMTYDTENFPVYEEVSEETAEEAENAEGTEETKEAKKPAENDNKFTGGNIFIIEDSDIDLGLLESVDHNFLRFMEILDDYLEWHFEQMHESQTTDPLRVRELSSEEKKLSIKRAKRRGLFGRISRFFGRHDDKKDETPEENVNTDAAESADNTDASEDAAKNSEEAEKKPKSLLEAIKSRFKSITGKKEKPAKPDDEDDIKPTFGLQSDEADKIDEANTEKSPENEIHIEIPEWDAEDTSTERKDDIPKFLLDDLTEKEEPGDLLVPDGTLDDFECIPGLLKLPRTRYRQSCFLKFGFDEIDSSIAIEHVKGYLTARGFGVKGYEDRSEAGVAQYVPLSDNSLMNARNRDADPLAWLDSVDNSQDMLYCDFCGTPLSGVSYEQLADGRVRCNDCSSTAIENVEEFRRLFEQHLALMESYYQIKINKPVKVIMTDARTIARGNGQVFKPTRQMDARVVGYAQKKNNKYNLFIENGSPRLATIETMVHEMTHIWQYLIWDDKKLYDYYGRSQYRFGRLLIYEGMAVWSSIQYLYLIGETSYANVKEVVMKQRLEADIIQIITSMQTRGRWELGDPYAWGYKFYSEEYPINRNMEMPQKSPFKVYPPLTEKLLIQWVVSVIEEYMREKGLQP